MNLKGKMSKAIFNFIILLWRWCLRVVVWVFVCLCFVCFPPRRMTSCKSDVVCSVWRSMSGKVNLRHFPYLQTYSEQRKGLRRAQLETELRGKHWHPIYTESHNPYSKSDTSKLDLLFEVTREHCDLIWMV